MARPHRIARVAWAALALAGPVAAADDAATHAAAGPPAVKVWSSAFTNGVADWPFSGSNWGDVNRSYAEDPAVDGRVLRVFIGKGSTDPATMAQARRPIGGQGMKLKLDGFRAEAARLSFKVKLPADFKPGLGGKLGPGLCGGSCNGGGRIPTGADGWSARIGFDERGNGTVYAYLPTSVSWGTVIGTVPLARGRWTSVVEEVRLNTVGQADGQIKVWADGRLVVDRQGLVFRTTDSLKIDGLYFDTFYGGQTPRFAAPQDTVIEFAEFAVYAVE